VVDAAAPVAAVDLVLGAEEEGAAVVVAAGDAVAAVGVQPEVRRLTSATT
jgi:hypothetical protein